MKEPSEPNTRVLHRIADQMRSGFNGRIELDLRDGAVLGYREVRSIRLSDMEPPPLTGFTEQP